MKRVLLLAGCWTMFVCSSALALDDARALASLAEAPVIHDVRTAEIKSLQFILKVIADTRNGLLEQNVTGDVIVSMRGPTVKLLVTGSQVGTPEARAALAKRISTLSAQGVRLEACGYALDLFALDPQDLIDGVTPVGNSLLSLIGYQNKGYAYIPMN